MSINQTCDKHPLNPSSCLTDNLNVATPLLLSHRQGIAYAQAQKARAAKEAEEAETEHPIINPTSLYVASSSPGLLLTPTATPPAASQPGSVPPTTAPPSECENILND